MYGPYNDTYYQNGGIRPLDRGYYNTDLAPYYQLDIDGFDFDIEVQTTGKLCALGISNLQLTKSKMRLLATLL